MKINHEECFYAAVRLIRDPNYYANDVDLDKEEKYFPMQYKVNENKINVNWKQIGNVITNELYKGLSDKIMKIVYDKGIRQNDFSSKTIETVLTDLTRKIKLTQMEVQYISQLIRRCRNFKHFEKGIKCLYVFHAVHKISDYFLLYV